MASTRKSKSVNKQYLSICEVSPDKSHGNSRKSKPKLTDKLGSQWSKTEIECFYKAYREYGKDWKKVAAAVHNRSVEMVEALYSMNQAYLSLPDGKASMIGLIAMMTDHYNGLIMAPKKRQRTEGASSSNATTQPIRIDLQHIYEECFEDRTKYDHFQQYKNHKLKKERCVDIAFMDSDKFQFRYLHLFRLWKFMKFLSLTRKFFPTLVLIFYVNATCIFSEDKSQVVALESYLMGRRFRVDIKEICDAFGLEDQGIEDENSLDTFTGSVINLDVHDRFLHLIITWWFRPSNGKYSWIRQVDGFWINCFRQGKRPNLAKIIFADLVWQVQNRHTPQVRSFSYACALSALFMHLGINCSSDFVESVKEPIGETSLNRSHFQYIRHEWVRGEAPPPPPIDPEPINQLAPNVDLMAFLTSQFTSLRNQMTTGFDAINDRFNTMDGRLDSMDTRLTDIEAQHLSLRMSLEAFHDEWRHSNALKDSSVDDEDGDEGDDGDE